MHYAKDYNTSNYQNHYNYQSNFKAKSKSPFRSGRSPFTADHNPGVKLYLKGIKRQGELQREIEEAKIL